MSELFCADLTARRLNSDKKVMKSLLKAWEKFESFINRMIDRGATGIISSLKKIKIKRPEAPRDEHGNKLSIKERAKLVVRTVAPKIKQQVTAATKRVSKGVGTAVQKVQSIDRKKVAPKALAAALGAFIVEQGTKVKYWYLSIRPEVFLGYTVASAVVTVSSINIYKVTQSISKSQAARSPAQVYQLEQSEEGTGTGPVSPKVYGSMERRQLTLFEVVVPVQIESDVGIKTLLIDMEIQTSNRYSREILYKKEYLVKDRLNKNLRPIVPEFPLTDEGKRIIKDKVKKEIDALLKDLNIEGEVETVYLIYIMAA